MAKRRCTRREKAEEIAEVLFSNAADVRGDQLVLKFDDRCLGTWSKEAIADVIEMLLRPWQPTTAGCDGRMVTDKFVLMDSSEALTLDSGFRKLKSFRTERAARNHRDNPLRVYDEHTCDVYRLVPVPRPRKKTKARKR